MVDPSQDPVEPEGRDAALAERVGLGQTDLQDAIAYLRKLDLAGVAPDATYDPSWPEVSR